MFVKESRRKPSQERSKKRLAQILDASASVFAERGYDAATMEMIAERADTSIGSVYQFFRNKQEIFDGLAQTYRENLRTFFFSLMNEDMLALPWRELLATTIDALAEFHESQPGFRAVWVSMRFTKEFIAEGEAMNSEIASLVEAIFRAKLHVPPKKRAAVARMTVETMTASLIVAARRPNDAKTMIVETKELLERYLAPYEDPRLRSEPR